jgi:hypothetical protein
MTILDALHQMQENRYLHLPVVGTQSPTSAAALATDMLDGEGPPDHQGAGKGGAFIGLVDVLELTYGVMTRAGKDFWSSSLEQITDADQNGGGSVVSGSGARSSNAGAGAGTGTGTGAGAGAGAGGNDSASMLSPSVASGGQSPTKNTFVFKVRDDCGNMHRIHSSSSDYSALMQAVLDKLQNPSTKCLLKYKDDEGDEVTLSSDESLTEAVSLARASGLKVLHLSLSKINNPLSSVVTPVKEGPGAGHGEDLDTTSADNSNATGPLNTSPLNTSQSFFVEYERELQGTGVVVAAGLLAWGAMLMMKKR